MSLKRKYGIPSIKLIVGHVNYLREIVCCYEYIRDHHNPKLDKNAFLINFYSVYNRSMTLELYNLIKALLSVLKNYERNNQYHTYIREKSITERRSILEPLEETYNGVRDITLAHIFDYTDEELVVKSNIFKDIRTVDKIAYEIMLATVTKTDIPDGGGADDYAKEFFHYDFSELEKHPLIIMPKKI